ncbi:unnamed protein product [Prorocentrum cordatum]|uniref:Cilia- and flagella-associated protein 157 n=1 Tax=Prorocentrum cordatum TaxID=2364126 RepID=A0ABN9SA58_9DINO|nr:unnamed protein product [Polarella glacialis]
MPGALGGPYPHTAAAARVPALAAAGELAVLGPGSARAAAGGGSARRAQKAAAEGVALLARADVSEEWTKADDTKIAKLRGILSALQESNQSTQLLQKESEDSAAQRALEATRINVGTRMQACKEMEEMFTQKQNELRRHWLEEKKRLDQLEDNIQKSQKRSQDERLECRKLDEDIRILEGELAEQEAVKAGEQKRIRLTCRCKEFMEEVATECEGDFAEVEEIINRYNTLEQGNVELHAANAEVVGRLDELRERYQRESSALQNEHLQVSSKLHDCQGRLEHARVQSQQVEQSLNRALEEKSKDESEVGVIKMAIEQLFERALASCRVEQRRKAMRDAIDSKYAPVRMDKSDWRFDEMLRQIGERVEDLRDMHRHGHEKPRGREVPLRPAEGDEAIGEVSTTARGAPRPTAHPSSTRAPREPRADVLPDVQTGRPSGG